MRHCNAVPVIGTSAIVKQVQIKNTRRVPHRSHPPEFRSDAMQGSKRLIDRQSGLRCNDGVVEPGLVRHRNRCGFIPGRDSRHVNIRSAKPRDCRPHPSRALPYPSGTRLAPMPIKMPVLIKQPSILSVFIHCSKSTKIYTLHNIHDKIYIYLIFFTIRTGQVVW